MGLKTNIILVDDHSIIREGLKPLLEKEGGLQVVGEAETGRQAIALVRDKKPNLAIMDITMPDMNGIEATRHILAENEEIIIIALSVHTDHQYVAEMIRAGASGYLPKSCAFKELSSAIRTVLDGGTYLSPKVVESVMHYLRNSQAGDDSVRSVLTNREREVLQLLAEGKTTKEISANLSVSERTIDAHRQNIMAKLNLHSVAELTKYAIRQGMTSLE
jgi:DNA-binding NarL/FixJ family response regulator